MADCTRIESVPSAARKAVPATGKALDETGPSGRPLFLGLRAMSRPSEFLTNKIAVSGQVPADPGDSLVRVLTRLPVSVVVVHLNSVGPGPA